MQRRTTAGVLAILLGGPLLAILTLGAPAVGQVRIPESALEGQGQLQALLDEGERLEQERRWGDALNHWEDALKSFPGQQVLEQRRERTKVHYDLARRYADTSFVRSISQLSLEQSLELYNEVLLKINTYYVDTPNWQGLVGRGTFALENALLDETYVKQNLPRANAESISMLRAELHRQLDWRPIRSPQEAREAVTMAARMAQTRLGVTPSAVVMEYVCGAMGGLDDYSSYLTEAQLDDVYSQIDGNFVGLGIELKAENGTLSVINVIEGSPAYRAGMRGGDTITAVDGQPTADVSTDKAADMLKGEEGTNVDVTVLSGQGVTRVLRVRRERVEVPSIEGARIIDAQHGIAYFKINSFQKTTARDLDAALWSLYRQGMRSLIIDVRGNPGGLLTSSVEIADKFVGDGTIVSTRGRSPREDFDYKAHKVGTWRVPLYVLIDGDSASASEIFAGAIRDHRRGTIIGQRSYGKGSVQGIFPLGSSKAGVRLTTAKFYTPSGVAIAKRGVEPNLVVQVAAKPTGGSAVTEADDAVLAAGVQAARQQLISQR